MIFDEKDEAQKLLVSVAQLRRITGCQSLEAMVDMIDTALSLCLNSIKFEQPRISEKELMKYIKNLYGLKP